jgi:hypothetical protein
MIVTCHAAHRHKAEQFDRHAYLQYTIAAGWFKPISSVERLIGLFQEAIYEH